MKIVDDWYRVTLVSISFWAQVLGLLVLVTPEIVYSIYEVDINPAPLWWTGVLLLLFGIIGRFLVQENRPWIELSRIAGIFLVIILLCFSMLTSSIASECDKDTSRGSKPQESSLDISVPLIARWEGLRTDAYLDIVGVPTICYGSTRGIEIGMSMTKSQCDGLLREEVLEYRDGWLGYVESHAYNNWINNNREAAYTSLAYNVGIRAAGKSTATRRLNNGNIVGGCQAIGWWNKAGGRVVRGLVNRRSDETELCLKS